MISKKTTELLYKIENETERTIIFLALFTTLFSIGFFSYIYAFKLLEINIANSIMHNYFNSFFGFLFSYITMGFFVKIYLKVFKKQI